MKKHHELINQSCSAGATCIHDAPIGERQLNLKAMIFYDATPNEIDELLIQTFYSNILITPSMSVQPYRLQNVFVFNMSYFHFHLDCLLQLCNHSFKAGPAPVCSQLHLTSATMLYIYANKFLQIFLFHVVHQK